MFQINNLSLFFIKPLSLSVPTLLSLSLFSFWRTCVHEILCDLFDFLPLHILTYFEEAAMQMTGGEFPAAIDRQR